MFGAVAGNGAGRGNFIPAAKVRKNHPNKKENVMNRIHIRKLVVSLGATLLAAAAASAAEPDRLVVNVPYDFVVNGKTLPAGKYDVKRVDDSNLRVLSISSLENH